MDLRFGLLFLFVLGANCVCDATQLEAAPVVTSDASVVQINKGQEGEVVGNVVWKENACSKCVEFATDAIDYLSQNTTQMKIFELLQWSCALMPSIFQMQCIELVEYCVELFFVEITSIKPEDFCQKLNLCSKVALTSSQIRKDSCGVCHHAVSEVITKLEDPDIQLEIIELLLKGCSVQNYEKKCNGIVFEYGPLILGNTVHFLETVDVCTILHACDGAKHELVADS